MQNSYRFTKGWQALIGKRIWVRLAYRWWFPAAILIWALGFGISFPSTVIQAQDGGTGSGTALSAQFVLQVNTSDPKLNRLCLGQTILLPVRVAMQTITFSGSGDIGDFTVRNAAIDPVVANPSIVTAVQSADFFGDAARNAPFQVAVEITGEEVGSTTIELRATVQSTVMISFNEEVGLPIPVTSQADPRTVPVRVVPCAYRVTMNSIWETSMHGAFTVLIANVRNARLVGRESDRFEFEPPLAGTPFLEWTWANNRIIGCWASGGHFNSRAPRMEAHRVENNVELTINYEEAQPGDGNSQYYRNLCLPHFTAGTSACQERPDGYCWTWPEHITHDWFRPQTLQPPALTFPLDGGSITTRQHLINHSWGSANGTTIITITPDRIQ